MSYRSAKFQMFYPPYVIVLCQIFLILDWFRYSHLPFRSIKNVSRHVCAAYYSSLSCKLVFFSQWNNFKLLIFTSSSIQTIEAGFIARLTQGQYLIASRIALRHCLGNKVISFYNITYRNSMNGTLWCLCDLQTVAFASNIYKDNKFLIPQRTISQKCRLMITRPFCEDNEHFSQLISFSYHRCF